MDGPRTRDLPAVSQTFDRPEIVTNITYLKLKTRDYHMENLASRLGNLETHEWQRLTVTVSDICHPATTLNFKRPRSVVPRLCCGLTYAIAPLRVAF
jgi:hypothetical protein